MSWFSEKLTALLKLSDRNRSINEPHQNYSLTELEHPIVDDNKAKEQMGEEELTTPSEAHIDKQLNSEPHDDTNDEIMKMFWQEEHSPHLFFEPLTEGPQNVNEETDAKGVGYNGYDLVGSSQQNENDRKINLISSKSDGITIEELRKDNPSLADYLSSFGVKTLDREVVSKAYERLCVQAVKQEKPISEFLKSV